jgi:hypothetical protein
VPNVREIWEPKIPGTLWATPGLLWDSFTFTFYIKLSIKPRSMDEKEMKLRRKIVMRDERQNN